MPLIFLIVFVMFGAVSSFADATQNDPAQAQMRLDALTLTQAKTLFLSRNRELLSARRVLEGVQADAVSAGQRPNPTLSMNASSINPNAGIGGGGILDKQVDTVIRLDQLFERGDKRKLRSEAAELNAQASKSDLGDALRQLQVGLNAAYYDLLLAQDKERIIAESTALYQKSLSVMTLRLKAGDISPADEARIRVEVLRAENDLQQANAEHAKAQFALAYMLGVGAGASKLKAADSWPMTQKQPEAGQMEGVIDGRSDVKAAQARLQVAEKNRDLARALRKRDITVGVQYEHFPPNNSNMYGVGVSVPLFANYNYEGEIRRAEVDLQAARDQVARVRAKAWSEIDQARADLDAMRERLDRYQGQLLASAKKSADAAEFAYSHGALGVMDLLDVRRTLRATLLEAATAQSDYVKALSTWQGAVFANNGEVE